MEIRYNDEICIIAPICEKLDNYNTKKMLEKLRNESRKVAIDLNYVQECSIDFIDGIRNLSKKDLGIFNIPSDIFVLFNIMNIDKTVKLYVSESDFESDTHQIINRKFALI